MSKAISLKKWASAFGRQQPYEAIRSMAANAALESAKKGTGMTPSGECSQIGTTEDHWNKASEEIIDEVDNKAKPADPIVFVRCA